MAVLNKYDFGGKIPWPAVNIMRTSIYGNPYHIGYDGTRAQVIAKYEKWLMARVTSDQKFAARVEKLHGKDLCCCCKPLACHGDVLQKVAAMLANDKPVVEESFDDLC